MKLSVEQLRGLIKESRLDGRGKNIYGICPKCSHNEFGISTDDNHRFACFRRNKCGYRGNIFTLLKDLGRLQDFIGDGDGYSRTEEQLVNRIIKSKVDLQIKLPECPVPLGWKRTFDNTYLNERRFTQHEYEKYKVGTSLIDPDVREDYVVFLIEEEGVCVGWVARHVKSKKEIDALNKAYGYNKVKRYLNSKIDFSKIALGTEELTENTETIILVEGIFDKINVDRLYRLDEDDSVKCLCTFKCQVLVEQIFKIKEKAPNIKTIILLYDNDVINQIKVVGLELDNYYDDVRIALPKSKDPDEMVIEELDEVISGARAPQVFINSVVQVKKLL